jgi:hypothetical protein
VDRAAEEWARRDIQDNPVILEHIGSINEIEIDFAASDKDAGADVFVYRLEGSRGPGILTAETITVDEYTERVTWGILRLESGETYELFPGQGDRPPVG